METYLNTENQECVIVTNEDGTIWSGLKSTYEATLASESANDPAGNK